MTSPRQNPRHRTLKGGSILFGFGDGGLSWGR